MKKLQVTVAITLVLGLFLTAANVFANPAAQEKPRSTPGAQGSDHADARATHANNGQGHNGNGNNGNGNNGNHGNGNGNNGNGSHGPQTTPGAKATDKADERATAGLGKLKGQRLTFRGVVANVGGGSLTLTLAGGGSQTFAVTAATRIHIPTLGGGATLADVNVGASALVQVLKNDASMTALYISVVPGKPQPVHRVGIVTAYTPGASITVQDKKGQSSTFLITPATKILPAERANQLGVGSFVTIISRRDPTGGPLTAQGIVVHPRRAEPTATATGATSTATATATATATLTETATPTETATSTATATEMDTDTPTATATASATDTDTPTPTATPTATETATP